VKISQAQAELLTTEARSLADRTTKARQQLTALERDPSFKAQTQLLSASVSAEKNAVSRVGSRFQQLAATPDQRSAGAVFFDDFVNRYARAASQVTDLQPARYAAGRDSTLRVLDDNYKAYTLVAASSTMTFDLDVGSTPAGAAVSFRRIGDPYQNHPDQTQTTIKNLVYALWTIRAEKNGKTQEKDHDPYRETNHVVHFDF